jgi:ATP-dependent Clp protease adaptor protein ClpS
MIVCPRQAESAMQSWPSLGSGAPDVTLEPEVVVEESLDIPWSVVVHNDPINLMDYVTKVIMRIFGYPKEKAERHMMEVHKAGRSILWTGGRERAEFFVEQLQQHLLVATMEQSQ